MKIKRITFEAFLGIKKLLSNLKQTRSNKIRHRNKKPYRIDTKLNSFIKKDVDTYEPSNISNVYDSLFWRWRRVIDWERYVNDPIENKNGHMIT